ncbi:MAG: protein phosphatase 2C domain-containing protein [Tetrasphaera sp.]
MLAVEVGIASHVGRVREINEDAIFAGTRLFAVADGMGGHAAGDVASRTVVDVLAHLDGAPLDPGALRSRVAVANDAVLHYGRTHPQGAGLGTTLAGIALITESGVPHWAVFNIGDSRVYRLADGTVRQLTVDHSEVEEMVSGGLISREEARHHPSRHIVTRVIGEIPPPVLDLVVVPVIHGDRWLITSDGLTSELDDDDIARQLGRGESASATAAHLVESALGAGGRDNVSVIVVDVTDAELAALDVAQTTIPREKVES